ncbi:hypothetical protein Q1695_002414 [Nippostrongylus brasiliensis]|nr:hypothetical protein Q1695_002414 [Nippostrongylus brasiliensis]
MWLVGVAISLILTRFSVEDESPFHRVVSLDCELSLEEDNPLSVAHFSDENRKSVVLVKGVDVDIENCEEKIVERNESQNCESLCGNHGKCSLREKGTPIEHYECLCEYGWRGMHCDEEMHTKFPLMYVVWLFVIVEIVMVVAAVKRFANRKFFESPLPTQRFVDIMSSRSDNVTKKQN